MASVPLVVAGGGVQIAGFGLALWQSVRTRREQSPDEASLARWAWASIRRRGAQFVTWSRRSAERVLVRLHLMQPRAISVSLDSSLGISGALKAHLSTGRRGLPLEERVDGLEKDVDDLRRKQGEDRARLEGRIEEVRSDIESQQAAQQSEQARRLGRSLRYQELGIYLFVLGVAMATVGSVG